MAIFGHFLEKGSKIRDFPDPGRGFYINPSPGSPGPGPQSPRDPGAPPGAWEAPGLGIRDPGSGTPGPEVPGDLRTRSGRPSRGSPGLPAPPARG